MRENEKYSITTQVLVSILVEAGFRKNAKQIANEFDISKQEAEQIIQSPQALITNVEYDDAQLSLLKEIVINSRRANKVVQFEYKDNLMLVYPSGDSKVTIEYIHSKNHVFIQNAYAELSIEIGNFYGLNSMLNEDPVKRQIGLSEELYDELHFMKIEELDGMIDSKEYDPKIRHFLSDFKRNNQQVSKFVYQSRESTNSTWELESGMALVPGKNFIWHITTDDSSDKILLISNTVNHYTETIKKMVVEFLEEQVIQPIETVNKSSSRDYNGAKFFSIKRGFSFFWKSNFFLLIAILCFFINKSSWILDGGLSVISFSLLWEAFILICSFIACFKPREIR